MSFGFKLDLDELSKKHRQEEQLALKSAVDEAISKMQEDVRKHIIAFYETQAKCLQLEQNEIVKNTLKEVRDLVLQFGSRMPPLHGLGSRRYRLRLSIIWCLDCVSRLVEERYHRSLLLSIAVTSIPPSLRYLRATTGFLLLTEVPSRLLRPIKLLLQRTWSWIHQSMSLLLALSKPQ